VVVDPLAEDVLTLTIYLSKSSGGILGVYTRYTTSGLHAHLAYGDMSQHAVVVLPLTL